MSIKKKMVETCKRCQHADGVSSLYTILILFLAGNVVASVAIIIAGISGGWGLVTYLIYAIAYILIFIALIYIIYGFFKYGPFAK